MTNNSELRKLLKLDEDGRDEDADDAVSWRCEL